ncbi:MAG: hypothetical protein JWQ71_1374 [Pedosphaera sp.]|nr:hypothetical protein [Pedosphaera sp.]
MRNRVFDFELAAIAVHQQTFSVKSLLPFTLGFWLLAASAFAQLTLPDVQSITAQAVTRAVQVSPHGVIAIVDREGFVLGVWSVDGTMPATATFTNLVANAIAKAGTASYLSSDQHAFTSRTAGFIVQQNFPPGVQNKPPGPLVGVNFSNLPFSDINKFKGPGSVIVFSSTPGTAIVPVPAPVTGGLAGSPGGVPLFKNGRLVGGIGVAGDGDGPTAIQANQVPDIDEDVALAGQTGYVPAEVFLGSHVLIDGIRLPYVNSTTSLSSVIPFASLPGASVAAYPLMAAPAPFAYPTLSLGGSTVEVRQPIMSDPIGGTINGKARLTAAEVTNILALAANRARSTRAGIRLPRGQVAQTFITVVNNPNADGVAPTVLGTIRTPGATLFSWDVAVQKARTAVFYSATNRAFSSRTVGFLAQSHFPPGIGDTGPGLFLGMQERFSMFRGTNPVNGAVVTNAPSIDPNLPNGITIFPGGFPLYRNGELIGAIGVSGDGIDQDDLIAASGAKNFLPPPPIRGDQFFYSNARLTYAKFPRNPAL